MRFKYPRTPHLPWSKKVTDDDIIGNIPFKDQEVVVTRKMDGENFTGHTDGSHARSPDSRYHPSRDWSRGWWAQRAWQIPKGWRVSCENLYAQHSLRYNDLDSYVLGFAVWDDTLTCLSWDDTQAFFQTMDIVSVPVLWRGIWDEKTIQNLWDEEDAKTHEGYVVRSAKAFHFDDFAQNVRKFVRPNHVTTDTHWMHQEVVPNGLKEQ